MKTKILFSILSLLTISTIFFFIFKNQNTVDTENISVPINYTLLNYTVAEITDISCKKSIECITPGKYLMRSSCPYTSLCINDKCNIICPSPKNNYDYRKY
jgi:hypothetical protein